MQVTDDASVKYRNNELAFDKYLKGKTPIDLARQKQGGLDDVTTYPLITKALVKKGYAKKDITKILGGNFLRVLKANEAK